MARPLSQQSLSQILPVGSKIRAKLKNSFEPRRVHGGVPSTHKRKTVRPFTSKAPLHLVMRSSRARGTWSMLHRRNKARITSMIYVYAERFHVKVYRAANVGNHIHLLVKAEERKNLADFLRVLAGRIAVTVSGAQKGVKRIGRFWDYLYWSRLVSWGRDFYQVRKYVLANELEKFSNNRRELIHKSEMWDEWNFGPYRQIHPRP